MKKSNSPIGCMNNERGLTLLEMLITIVIFVLTIVFVISLISNAIDKPKQAGVINELDHYAKQTKLALYELKGTETPEEIQQYINTQLDKNMQFIAFNGVPKNNYLAQNNQKLSPKQTLLSSLENLVFPTVVSADAPEVSIPKSKKLNAYSNPYTIKVTNNGSEIIVLIETTGKETSTKYKLGVVKQNGTIDYFIKGFGRNNKNFTILPKELQQQIENGTSETEPPTEPPTEEAPSDFQFSSYGETAVMLSGYTGTSKDIVIPSDFEGKPVKMIGVGVFNNKGLNSVVIPNSVETIDMSAFKNNNLTSVTLPTSLVSIGANAFESNKLSSLTIPASVQFINSWAFTLNNLTSLVLPSTLNNVGANAFASNKLSEVRILNNSITLTPSTFAQNQQNPADLTIYGGDPSMAKNIANALGYTFVNESLFTYTDNGDSTATVTGYTGASKAVVVPSKLGGLTVTKIGDNSFKSLALTSVTLPTTLKEVGRFSFSDNLLTSINLPNGLISIDSSAFEKNKLTSVEIPRTVTTTNINMFKNNQIETIKIYPEIKYIMQGAFANNLIKEVNLPEGIVYVDMLAFSSNKIDSVTLPSTMKTIADMAFANNTISTLNLNEGLQEIGASAFTLNKLTSVRVPSSVSKINNQAFTKNTLTKAYILNKDAVIDSSAFSENQVTATNLTIYGLQNSTAQQYAFANGHGFSMNF